MISRVSLNDRVREWGLREEVVEKDYVLGWLLWGIGSEELLRNHWVFKGGTCLKSSGASALVSAEDREPLARRVISELLRERGISHDRKYIYICPSNVASLPHFHSRARKRP